MPVLSHPAFGPKASIIFITVGCLIDVWVAVWYFAFVRGGETPPTNTTWFWLLGLFLTGLTLLIIGVLLGKIGQAARRAELPPSEALPAEASIQKTAAANQPAVAAPPGTVMPGAAVPGVVAPGTVVPGAVAPAAPAAPPAPHMGVVAPAVNSNGVPVVVR